MVGLEPTQLALLPPQDSVSTNSTTSAKFRVQIISIQSTIVYVKIQLSFYALNLYN